MATSQKFNLRQLDQMIGRRLVDFEVTKASYSSSGVDEVLLSFDDGKEIIIFRHDDGSIHVEGD